MCWLNSATAYSPIISYDWPIQYFYMMYWGINTITTISYGDIASNNPITTVYDTAMMCFGFIVFAYIVNNIIKIILWANKNRDEFRMQLIIFTKLMDRLEVPPEVHHEVRLHLENTLLHQKNRQLLLEDEMKAKLPEGLREELVKTAYSQMYEGLCSMFGGQPEVSHLLFQLKEKTYPTGSTILRQGCLVDRLLFLHEGSVALQCNYRGVLHPLGQLVGSGHFVAAEEMFMEQQAPFGGTANQPTTMYQLPAECIHGTMGHHPTLAQIYQQTRRDLALGHSHFRIFHHCFFCDG